MGKASRQKRERRESTPGFGYAVARHREHGTIWVRFPLNGRRGPNVAVGPVVGRRNIDHSGPWVQVRQTDRRRVVKEVDWAELERDGVAVMHFRDRDGERANIALCKECWPLTDSDIDQVLLKNAVDITGIIP